MSSSTESSNIYLLTTRPIFGSFAKRWILDLNREMVAWCKAVGRTVLPCPSMCDGFITFANHEHAAQVFLNVICEGETHVMDETSQKLASSLLLKKTEDMRYCFDEEVWVDHHEVFSSDPIGPHESPESDNIYGPWAKTFRHIIRSKTNMLLEGSQPRVPLWKLSISDRPSDEGPVKEWAIATMCGLSASHCIEDGEGWSARIERLPFHFPQDGSPPGVLPWYFVPEIESCEPSSPPVTVTGEDWAAWCDVI